MQKRGWFRALSDDGQQFDILELPANRKEGGGLLKTRQLRTMDGKNVEVLRDEMYRIVESGQIVRRLSGLSQSSEGLGNENSRVFFRILQMKAFEPDRPSLGNCPGAEVVAPSAETSAPAKMAGFLGFRCY